MALLVLLVPSEKRDVLLRPESLEALAEFGVTSVALARDERTAAYILEGWAFDPASDGAAVAALADAVALQPVVHMAVSAAAIEEGAR